MANAIRTTIKVEYFEGNAIVRSIPSRVYNVVTTSGIVSDNTQLVGTTHEQVAIGDVTDDAFLMVQNMHATALVQVGLDVSTVFTPLVDIPAGGPPAIIPIASTLADTYLKSSVASTPVRVTLIKVVVPV
jgi:hypothetical protein